MFDQFLGPEGVSSILVVLNLILIESLLSVDNAAVLATMVLDLPKEQRGKALRYGIIGAYLFRGLALFFVTFLIKIWWLKPLGGLYLLYLAYDYFTSKDTPEEEDDTLNKSENSVYKLSNKLVGKFWATVILIEIMDMAFSIDNVFAAVAFTDKLELIIAGVFIGILAMRFVAQRFVDLMEKYPALEKSAFVVIGILGLKLTLSFVAHYMPETTFAHILESETTDLMFSVFTVVVFLFPIFSARFLTK